MVPAYSMTRAATNQKGCQRIVQDKLLIDFQRVRVKVGVKSGKTEDWMCQSMKFFKR